MQGIDYQNDFVEEGNKIGWVEIRVRYPIFYYIGQYSYFIGHKISYIGQSF